MSCWFLYIQWCDAKAQPCIIIEQDASGSNRDVVVVDLAPLRSSNLSWAVDSSLSMAAAAGARRIDPAERPLEAVPIDAIPVNLPHTVEEVRASCRVLVCCGHDQCQQAGMS